MRVVHLGRSTCHAIRDLGDKSTRKRGGVAVPVPRNPGILVPENRLFMGGKGEAFKTPEVAI